jgi:DNA modification methylase/predicted RNA-binding Zn-ribbon protein involved in translation (DUF1610 family)
MRQQLTDQSLLRGEAIPQTPVECLGMTFENDEARRAYFLDKLQEGLVELHTKLSGVPFTTVEDAVARMQSIEKWPMGDEARVREIAERMRHAAGGKDLLQRWKDEMGFPRGEIEDILRLSDPPYYTACPNPFMTDFIKHYGKPYSHEHDSYHREPFATDVSEGKNDPIYNAHAYYTKVPHKAIMRYILHYTEPGDIILDGFAGSGMTGVAAHMCSNPDSEFKRAVETEWEAQGVKFSRWGARRVVLSDLGPAATFIAANYNLPFDLNAFKHEAWRILKELERELGWMYETLHADGKTKGKINYIVWSEVFTCPECGESIIFFKEALDPKTKRVKYSFRCPSCSAELTKDNLQKFMETLIDPATNVSWQRVRFVPVLINYSVGNTKYEKQPEEMDFQVLKKIASLPFPPSVPFDTFPIEQMYHGSRLAPKGFTRIHHLYFLRTIHILAILWEKIFSIKAVRQRNILLFWFDSHLVNLSIQNRYRPEVSFPYNPLTGVYYISSLVSEANPFIAYENKVNRLSRAFAQYYFSSGNSTIGTGDCGELITLPDNSVDYIFTDPPFGENIYYGDLSFMVESWYRIWTNVETEAIIDQPKGKKLVDYQRLMQSCFEEYYRVLKPGRWMTMVFHNSRNSVWNAIQEAMLASGFVVADVRTLDKQLGSYRQVTSTAVKQDLTVSAYKPNGGLEERFRIEAGTFEGVWDFVRSHLRQLPIFVQSKDGRAEVIAERMSYLLFDRMVSYHVQHHVTIPLSASEFYAGLAQRFPERDGMYFLPEQVVEYDKRRMTVKEILQIQLFVTDESSAIQWLRQQLTRKPQTFQEIHPQFLRELGGWQKHEKPLELFELLEENFLRYDGRGPIAEQIWSWMQKSGTLRERMKGQDRESADASLRAEAKDRWYVPDPNKAQDLEKLRERNLLREYEEYKTFKGRQLKVFRLEAVRAGFKKAWAERNYQAILNVAAKIPEQVLQEDPKLLMWYDQALTRAGNEG